MRRRQVGGLINTTGYLKGAKTNRNPVNVIPSNHITTDGMSGPIMANGQILHPDTGDYLFPHPFVVEHKLAKGGHTVTTPQYLSIYPKDKNTLPPMTKSLRGKKQKGGRHFDPQLGNYMSNIYAVGGLTYPGYPYAGYNDSERGMFSGIMQGGGMYPAYYQGAPPPPPYFLAHAQMGGMPMPLPAGAMPIPGQQVPPQMPPMQMPPPQRGKAPRGKKRGRMQGGGDITPESVAAAKNSGYDDVTTLNKFNSILAGTNKGLPHYGDMRDQLAMKAYLYAQQPSMAGRGPEDRIRSFFGQPNTGSSLDSLRQKYNTLNPVDMYWHTPDVTVRQGMGDPNHVAASSIVPHLQIGGTTSYPSYRTAKITSRFQPDQSNGEMADDWKDVFYGNPDMKKGGHWIQGAVNPKHRGFCTPLSNPKCTGHRRALALLFKRKHGFHKKQLGGYQQGGEYNVSLQEMEQLRQGGYNFHVLD